jgi:tetratricopeptide (TPR) repeat protein
MGMRAFRVFAVCGSCFVLGVFATLLWAGAKGVDTSAYHGKGAKEAGLTLLAAAEIQAGSGSWERIGVGRIYYLSGDQAKGQAIFDEVAKKADRDDWERIAKVYEEAGDWEKAEPIFRRLSADAKDADGLALAGAFYNLHGDRQRAEELFDRAFAKKSDEVWNTLNAAGSYLGVKPD